MTTYLLHVDLEDIRERLSRCLRCSLGLADTRSILRSAGFVECSLGWLTYDVRPLMITFHRQGLGKV
ncbi:MAG: hypothetical protein IPM18_00850 [Phycisphaerales bacterium]|nr:hypothetical protein [Phycisphaerales bacterium]